MALLAASSDDQILKDKYRDRKISANHRSAREQMASLDREFATPAGSGQAASELPGLL